MELVTSFLIALTTHSLATRLTCLGIALAVAAGLIAADWIGERCGSHPGHIRGYKPEDNHKEPHDHE